MEPLTLGAAAAGLGATALGGLWWRSRREARRLRARLAEASRELQRLQHAFARFAPEDIVERVASGLPTSAERKEVTALFADIVGYTPLAESLEPPVLVEILNGYFERLSRAITDHRGHVSTFVGDGVLALFGAFEPNPWQSDDAVRAALVIRRHLADYGRELRDRDLPGIAAGVGLHRGHGVAGLVGSRDLTQYAFVGRTVNVASRVQELTRSHGADVLLTGAVRAELDPRFRVRAVDRIALRGVAEPVEVFAVEAFEGG